MELPAADQTRIVGGAGPVRAAVVGAEHALSDIVVDALAPGPRCDGEGDGAEVAARQTVRTCLGPGEAFVRGAEDLGIGGRGGHRRRASSAATASSSALSDGARPRVNVVRIVGIEDQPDAAG